MKARKTTKNSRYTLFLLGTCIFCASGCIFDASGLASDPVGEDSTIRDGAGYLDFHASADGSDPEVDMVPKVDTLQPCTTGQFKCLPDGTGKYCAVGKWKNLGKCPLGCAEGAKACRIPSNVPPDQIQKGTGNLDATGKGSPITINTDTGQIKNIRSGVPGLDSASGIHFATVTQKGTTVGLGVLSMKQLIVPQGTVIKVVGSRALVILASETASIKGILFLGSVDQTPGPGGFAGGNPGMSGQGQCGGKTGKGDFDGASCGSGGGGAGHGGSGGGGGNSTCGSPRNHKGGAGGSSCGSKSLVPLVGGSGGAGGSSLVGASNPGPGPGPGGGGGGAIQISAGLSIKIGPGGINAGGGGGGLSTSSGGAGGGAGGAILLEAPTVSLSGGVLAGNGGGGGGGDCH